MATGSEPKGGGSDDDEAGSDAEAVDDVADEGDQESSAEGVNQHAASDNVLEMHLPGTAPSITVAEAAVERSGYRQVRAVRSAVSVGTRRRGVAVGPLPGVYARVHGCCPLRACTRAAAGAVIH